MKLPKRLKSRKLWATVAACIATVLHDTLGLDPDSVKGIIIAISAYVVGQGVADHAKASSEDH